MGVICGTFGCGRGVVWVGGGGRKGGGVDQKRWKSTQKVGSDAENKSDGPRFLFWFAPAGRLQKWIKVSQDAVPLGPKTVA